MEKEFNVLKEFIIKHKIDLGIFIPHDGLTSKSKHLIENKENDLEEQLFSISVKDGYQSEISFRNKSLEPTITYKEFKLLFDNRMNLVTTIEQIKQNIHI